MLIGAGVMVKRAIAKLTSLGHKNISISNRTMSRVEHLSEVFDHLSVIPYASIRKRLQDFSTIYVAISSKSMIINCNDLMRTYQALWLLLILACHGMLIQNVQRWRILN